MQLIEKENFISSWSWAYAWVNHFQWQLNRCMRPLPSDKSPFLQESRLLICNYSCATWLTLQITVLIIGDLLNYMDPGDFYWLRPAIKITVGIHKILETDRKQLKLTIVTEKHGICFNSLCIVYWSERLVDVGLLKGHLSCCDVWFHASEVFPKCLQTYEYKRI